MTTDEADDKQQYTLTSSHAPAGHALKRFDRTRCYTHTLPASGFRATLHPYHNSSYLNTNYPYHYPYLTLPSHDLALNLNYELQLS